MADILRPILEISVIIPGIFLAYLPAKRYLKYSIPQLIAWLLPLMCGICLLCGFLCYKAEISTEPGIILAALISSCIYIHTLDISLWKSVSIALAVCAVFACVNNLSRAINAIITAEGGLWFCVQAGLIYNLICWVFVLLAWYPATHAAKMLVEDENMAETWYIFWPLPLIFVALNVFMIPRHDGTLYQGRIMQGYIILSIALLIILALFYAMFLIIANNLNRNARLTRENDFLSMQQSRYNNLCTTIEETRHARHDMRHHFLQLSALAQDEEWDKLKQYLENVTGKLPNQNLKFSDNRAADSVISYYYELAARDNIPFFANIELADTIPVDEIEMCLVLSNLLENALEASWRTTTIEPYIKLEMAIHSDFLLLILVENAYDTKITEKNGIFHSSKRKGNGIGTQSVRRIAMKNDGDSHFTYQDNVFVAKVMLRR